MGLIGNPIHRPTLISPLRPSITFNVWSGGAPQCFSWKWPCNPKFWILYSNGFLLQSIILYGMEMVGAILIGFPFILLFSGWGFPLQFWTIKKPPPPLLLGCAKKNKGRIKEREEDRHQQRIGSPERFQFRGVWIISLFPLFLHVCDFLSVTQWLHIYIYACNLNSLIILAMCTDSLRLWTLLDNAYIHMQPGS